MTTSADRTHEYFQSEEYNMNQATFVNTKGYLYDIRAYVLGPSTTSMQSHDEALQNTGFESGHHDASTRQRRLPNIELARFDYTITEWEPFRDLLRSLIHEDPGIADVEKLWYLKSFVTSEAAKALKSIQVTNHTYETACRALASRYENKRFLVRTHIMALGTQRPLNESKNKL